MALGKPVIASDIGGYASVISHGVDGLLVKPKDDNALAQALLSLMADERMRQQMGAMGQRKAQDYNWKHIAARLLDYYRKILSEPPWEKRFPELDAILV